MRAAVLAVATAILLSACDTGGGDRAAVPGDGAPAPTAASGAAPVGTPATTSGASPGPTTPSPPAVTPAPVQLPPEQALDLQVNHPNGTTLIVRSVSFHEDRIQIGFSVTNGKDEEISLAGQGMVIRDDIGTRYLLSPPPGNPELRITRQSTAEGTLVFLGRVAPRARLLTLVTNVNTAGGDNQYTTIPSMVVADIPVPDRGTASATPTPSATGSP